MTTRDGRKPISAHRRCKEEMCFSCYYCQAGAWLNPLAASCCSHRDIGEAKAKGQGTPSRGARSDPLFGEEEQSPQDINPVSTRCPQGHWASFQNWLQCWDTLPTLPWINKSKKKKTKIKGMGPAGVAKPWLRCRPVNNP